MIIQQALFLVLFFLIIFLSGSFLLHLLKLHESLSRALVFGFIVILAVFQLVAYPMVRLKTSFSLLFWTYSAILVAICLASVVVLLRRKLLTIYLDRTGAAVREIKASPLTPIFFVFAAAVYIVFLFFWPFSDTDDSYYLAKVMETIAQNRLGFDQGFYWTGMELTEWPVISDASTFEYFGAWMSAVSGVNATVLYRGVFSLTVTLLSFCAVYEAVCAILDHSKGSDKRALLTLGLYLCLIIMEQSQYATLAYNIARRCWQGKSILCSIIFPALMIVCSDIVRGDGSCVKPGAWALSGIILLSGAALSVVGLFLPLVCYFSLGFLFMLTRGRKNFRKLIVPVILSVLPVLIIAALTYIEMSLTRNETWDQRYVADWPYAFTMMLGCVKGFFALLYAAALVYVAIKREPVSFFMLVGAPVVLLLTFLNPLLVKPVSFYVTSGTVYWRLFWLLPIHFVPAFAAAGILLQSEQHSVRLFVLGAATAMIMTAYWGIGTSGVRDYLEIFRLYNPYQQVRSNPYCIDERVVAAAELILEDYDGEGRPVVLSFGEEAFRQYSVEIALSGGLRLLQKQYLTGPVAGTDMTERQFYTYFFTQQFSGKNLDKIARSLGIDYMYLDVSYEEQFDLSGQGFTLLRSAGGFDLWKCP